MLLLFSNSVIGTFGFYHRRFPDKRRERGKKEGRGVPLLGFYCGRRKIKEIHHCFKGLLG